MNRRAFLAITGTTLVTAGGVAYLLSDKSNFTREEESKGLKKPSFLWPDEAEILYLASLAPSGHNTQPWFVKYIEPYHYIIGNDKSKWLSAVDPAQRETILSIGAFLQNLEYAAANAGYNCLFEMRATSNQDLHVAEVWLNKTGKAAAFDVNKIKLRRTVRSHYLSEVLKKEDQAFLLGDEPGYFHFIPNGAKEYKYLNEQTIEANRLQSYREAAERELSEWIRFSTKDAATHNDGLTAASMEIEGLPGYVVRNFYTRETVMKKSFRNKNIDNVMKQVSASAGWMLVTSKDSETATLLETGRRMQRLFLQVRERGLALHPMTQILEEIATQQTLNQSIGINDHIQFILRMGYLKEYPDPVSLRRPVDWFVRT